MKTFRNPVEVHQPVGRYVHQIEISGHERLLVLSGQIGRTVDGNVPEDPIAQLDLAFDNLVKNLHAAGMQVEDIVKINLFLCGHFDNEQRREVTSRWLGGHAPCMMVVFVSGFVDPLLKLELEAWASAA